MRDLPPFALERYFAPREFAARAHLSCSDCEALALDDVLGSADAECAALWSALTLGYVETRGHPLLLAEIASLYEGLSAGDVLCAAPSEAILLAMTTLLSPGDRVIVAMPAYQSLHEIARSIGCEVAPWRPDESAGWRFDPERLRALAAGGAAMIVVNFPHNPTGALPSPGEWQAIVDVARERGAWLFSDEMYRFLEGDAPALPSAALLYERAVVLGGLSKAFGAPGLRAGWLVSRDRPALDRCAERKDYTTICGSGPSEALALMVLRSRHERLAANRATVAAGRAAAQALARRAPEVLAGCRSVAGCTALARLGPAMPPASALCDDLFRETGILLLPSTVFDAGDRHVRFGFGRRAFPAALDEFAVWCAGRL